jgi:hypothetical protein
VELVVTGPRPSYTMRSLTALAMAYFDTDDFASRDRRNKAD